MTIIDETLTCPCGSGLTYKNCCGPLLSKVHRSTTAAQLMRSRFTAYTQRNIDYLLATWDANNRPASIDFSKETAEWQKLQIISSKKGGAKDNKGIVEFKAFYRQDGIDYFMHEISRFIKTGQNWLYLDGVIKATGKVELSSSAGRNSPCTCDSGKKFKHCCGR